MLPWGQVVTFEPIDYRQLAEELCECVLDSRDGEQEGVAAHLGGCGPLLQLLIPTAAGASAAAQLHMRLPQLWLLVEEEQRG